MNPATDHAVVPKSPSGAYQTRTWLQSFAGDTSTADANGQGVGGQWFVVKAGGASSNNSSGGGTTTSDTSKRGYGY